MMKRESVECCLIFFATKRRYEKGQFRNSVPLGQEVG
uniref:Uncharacterized protein n=1 Tax=Rhizophora mucronata TaxID=61149 RepID=A0A2P2NR58_RHIMU